MPSHTPRAVLTGLVVGVAGCTDPVEDSAEDLSAVLSRKVDTAGGHASRQKALLYRLATLQKEHLKDPERARQSHERALSIDPDFRPSLRYLAADELGRGQRRSAARMYQHLSHELPGDAALPSDADERIITQDRFFDELFSVFGPPIETAALLNGRATATEEDMRTIAAPVLRHRIMLSYHAEAEDLVPDEIITELLLSA